MSVSDANRTRTAPAPRRRGVGSRLARRFWWIWLMAVPAGVLLVWDWSAGGESGPDRVERALGGSRPAPLATAVAERRTWAWDEDVPVDVDQSGGGPAVGVGGLAPGAVVAIEAVAPGVLRLSSPGNVAVWRFEPSMVSGGSFSWAGGPDHVVPGAERVSAGRGR